jgi:hypothetical protein
MIRYDFTTLSPGALPEGFAGEGWALAAVPRHPRNTSAIKAVDSPDYHVAFPSICKTLNGELLVVYREGLTHALSEDPHDGKIALIRSADGGRTWSDRVIIMDGDDYDDRNAAIACAPGGQLLVCWDKWKPRTHRGAFAMLSDDDGHTWSDPIRLQPIEDVHTRSPALMLKGGNWLIPLAEGEGGGQAAYATILNPVTGQSEMIPITPLGQEDLADEVCVTRAADGSLIALGRHWHERTLWQTRSHDEGRTWETPWLSSIPSQYTPGDLITLEDGRLVCSFSFRERRNERLVVSRDHGQTWEVENSLDVFDGTMSVGGDRSYPASVQIDADTIGTVLYETQAHPQGGAITFVRSPIADFARPPVTALYAPLEGPSPSEGPRFSRPLTDDCREIRLTYRFTGLFGDPPNRLELTVAGLIFGYQMGATRDRQGNINWVDVNGKGHEAVGDWFDDGNAHELALRRSDAGWTMSLDGREQITGAAASPARELSIAAVRAAVAIYDVEIT